MPSDNLFKHLIIAFALALVFYAGAFGWMQHRRNFRGPWEITFTTDGTGAPSLNVRQKFLNISEKIDFPGERVAFTNLNQTEQFTEASTNLPFGKWVFQDPTFLPGTVTVEEFDHQIELMPRVLIIDHKEVPWTNGGLIRLQKKPDSRVKSSL